jgi:hypothetical protein
MTEQITRHDTYAPADPNTNGLVTPGVVSGTGTITLTNTAGFTLNNVDLVFTAGNTNTWAQAVGDTVMATVTDGHVQIASFPASGVVHVTYSLIPGSAVPPITLSSTYSRNSVTDNTASSTVIHLTATLNPAALPSDVTSLTPTITLAAADNLGRGTVGLADWTLSSSSWSPALTTASPASTTDITATVNDVAALNDGLNGVSLNDMATSTVTYTVSSNVGTSSGITLTSVTANSPEVVSTIDKQFTGGVWVFTPKVSIPGTSTISYQISSISEWAVVSSDLNTNIASNTVNAGNHDGSHNPWPVALDATHSFTGTGVELLQFAYNGIPVGFMKPTIQFQNTPTQFPITATSTPNGVTLLKQIYVINGYQVEVVKTITAQATEGHYHINIVATNLGTQATPPHVVVYDIIPHLFYTAGTSPTNIVTNPSVVTNYQALTSTDEAVFWDIGILTPHLTANDHATIDYDVIGTGTYSAADLYVVGVDPAQSVNLQSTPVLNNVSTMASANFESLAALGAAGLLVVGMIGTARRRF